MEGKTVRNDRYGEYRNSRRNRKCGVRNGRKHRKFTAALFRVAVVLCFLLFVYGGVDYYQNRNLDRTFELLGQVGETARAVPAKVRELAWRAENAVRGLSGRQTPSFPLDEIPEYSGEPYVVVDGNVPGFTDEERASGVYEYYSDLDFLGRCGAAQAMLGPQLMPDEERGEISEVHPSGWHTARYDFIENGYLYNRCHLIAYAMTGENANEKNLITGTQYMNIEGMLPWEEKILQYIWDTGGRVLYRVTPVFHDSDLVARGVHMEAESIGSREIRFNIFVYNVQPGVTIDYSDGTSWKSGE